eukprot:2495955-Pleurochrysis_carterae.AAC.2
MRAVCMLRLRRTLLLSSMQTHQQREGATLSRIRQRATKVTDFYDTSPCTFSTEDVVLPRCVQHAFPSQKQNRGWGGQLAELVHLCTLCMSLPALPPRHMQHAETSISPRTDAIANALLPVAAMSRFSVTA